MSVVKGTYWRRGEWACVHYFLCPSGCIRPFGGSFTLGNNPMAVCCGILKKIPSFCWPFESSFVTVQCCMSNTTLLFWFFWGTTPFTAHTQSAFSCCYLPPRFHWENALWIHSLIRLSSFMKLSYLQCSVWMHTSSDKVLTQLSVWLLAWWNLMESHLLHFHNIRHKSNRDNFSRAHVPVLLNIPKGKELVFSFLLCSILFDIKIQVQIFRSF